MALLPSGTTRIVASCSAVTTQKHPTNGRKTSVASWNLISARSTAVLLILILGTRHDVTQLKPRIPERLLNGASVARRENRDGLKAVPYPKRFQRIRPRR